jgi:autotransporter-associated beta strand protein
VLTGTNTYSGGTRVHRNTLKVGTGGTLGTGPVENDYSLIFDSASTVEVTNLLSGTGSLTHQGAGTLKLGRVPDYVGPLTLNGTLDLCGSSAAFGALSGVGRVVNSSGLDLVLTVGSGNTNTVFSGQIDDGISLVKTGTGTLTLFNTNRYSGATTVSGGTLKMGSLSDISGLSYRLDASKLDSLTTLNDTNVTACGPTGRHADVRKNPDLQLARGGHRAADPGSGPALPEIQGHAGAGRFPRHALLVLRQLSGDHEQGGGRTFVRALP